MEKIRKENIVAALNICSSRITTCIAVSDLSEKDCLNIIGLGRAEGRLTGEKGVLDIDILSRAIHDSLSMAQEEAKTELHKAFISISGGGIKSEKSRGIVKLSQRGKEITDRDIKSVLNVANTAPIGDEREILHSIPQEFTVDNQGGINSPAGLFGIKLEVETLLVTIHVPFLQNIIKALNLAGVESEDAVFSGIAASQSFLSHDTERESIVLLELDNNFTAASFFFENVLKSIEVIEKNIEGEGMLKALMKRIDRIRMDKPISKIILVCNSYISEDLITNIESTTGIPTQIGYMRNTKGSARDINSPAYVSAIGLAKYGLKKRKEALLQNKPRFGLLSSVTRKFNDFVNEYF